MVVETDGSVDLRHRVTRSESQAGAKTDSRIGSDKKHVYARSLFTFLCSR